MRITFFVIQSKYFVLFLDLALANQDPVLVKMLRNATGHAMSSQSSTPVVMEKIADAILRSPDDYFQVNILFSFLRTQDSFLLTLFDFGVSPDTDGSFRFAV